MKLARRIIIVVLLALILIRPTISTSGSSKQSTNLNVWFVVDATGSMVAKDVENGEKRRYEKVQEDITSIVKNVPGAKYGLIVQDFTTYNAAPLSYDADAMISAETNVIPKYSYYSQPTNLEQLIDFALKRIALYKKQSPNRSNAIVVMSDGEDVSKKELVLSTFQTGIVDAAAVFGYGTTEGSLLEEINSPYLSETNGMFRDSYVLYYGDNENVSVDDRKRVLSKINENNLRAITSAVKGNYYHRENGSVPSEVINSFKETASTIKEEKDTNVSTGTELYYLFAIALLFMLLWEGEEILLKLLLEKEDKNA